jgi:hypothetical protein
MGATAVCAACPHLLTAHTVPDGLCLLCACPGWSDEPEDREARADGAASRHRFVVDVLSSTRYPACPDEYALQAAAAARLQTTGAPVEREVVLSATDRPDLLVGGVCVEVKVAGAASQVLAQLKRYARHPQVESLVLLTRRAQHRKLPAALDGKPLTVVFTAGVL